MYRIHSVLLAAAAAFALCSCAGTAPREGYPEVSLGDGGLKKGPRTVENIRMNVARMLPRIMYLYSEALGPDSTLRGVVYFRIEVDNKGKPGFVGVHQSTLRHEDLEDLMLAAIVQSEFDEWKEGKGLTEVIFPVELTPEAAKTAPKSRARRQFEKRQELKDSLGTNKPAETESNEWEDYEE